MADLRRLGPDLGPAALQLWNQGARFDPLTADQVWQDPDFEPDRCLAAFSDGRLIGWAIAVCRRRRAVVKMLVVHPDERRRGIGRQLLDAALAGVSGEVRVCESPPNYLIPGVDERDADTATFLRAMGFEAFETTRNLRVDLTRLPVSGPVAPGYRIERARAVDSAAVEQLLGAHWPSWQDEVASSLSREPPALFLAWDDQDRVAAFSAHDGNNRGTGWFGPMGTDPGHRGRGLGRALLLRSLEDFRRAGMDEAVIPWVGPVDFYREAVGAEVDRTFVRFRRAMPV